MVGVKGYTLSHNIRRHKKGSEEAAAVHRRNELLSPPPCLQDEPSD